jgi:acetoin utilization protein AcuC
MQNYSSGFCVFNDFAIAAKIAQQHGYKVAIFDLDAHHGDGTEELLRTEPILTYSVHDATIFPGTGMSSNPNQFAYNKPLASGAGDKELDTAVSEFIEVAQRFGATMIFIACGADGHALDPLSTLNYSVNGIASAVAQIRSSFLELPMLIGGAGGYHPDTFTPEIWSNAVLAAGTVKRVQTKRHYFDLAGIDLDNDQQLEALYDAIIDTLNKKQEEGEES